MEIQTLSIADYEDMVDLWSRVKLSFKPKGRDSRMRLFCALIETSQPPASQELFEKSGYVKHRDIMYFSKRDSDDV